MIHGHGGNIYRLAEQLGCRPDQIIDMSSNVNPLGPMPRLLEHLRHNLEAITALPQVDAAGAVTALAGSWNVPAERLLAANGTTHFIYCLPVALGLGRVLICGPTYADYADGCRCWNVACEHLAADPEDDFAPCLDKIDSLAAKVDAVYICNPNNPTGRLVRAARLAELAGRHRRTLFIVDQSYLPFVVGAEAESLTGTGLSNVIVLHSMSKIFRVPGLRIGFLEAAPEITRKVARFVQPWSVNSLAQETVRWLAGHQDQVADFIDRCRQYCRRQRREISRLLAAEGSIDIFPSTTSFILCRLPSGASARWLCRQLARERILIRNCDNFQGLDERYFRLSLKSEALNRKVAGQIATLVRKRLQQGGQS